LGDPGGGDKLALFEIDGVPCTLAICRDNVGFEHEFRR